jgi:L-alanine-DL-glutamate epimerase-like enolase superfamily enzyme
MAAASSPVLSWEKQTLKLRNPFRLSYGATEERQSFWLRLNGDEGWGEASIPPYYRVDAGEMIACWERANAAGRPLPDSVADVRAWVPADGPAPARCAIELALLDRIGKRRGIALHELLDLPRPRALSTTFTISIDTPDAMAAMARQIASYPLIKLKLGSDDDEGRVRAVREARPDAKLCVDANAGWTVDEAIAHLKWLEKYQIELIEQPLPKDQHAQLGEVQKRTSIPVVADESVQTMEDIELLGRASVRGINLKIMKVGGVLPGLTIVRRARELNMKVMLGCMIESSIGITAAAHLAGLADWLDLDAPLLITNDPFDGVRYDEAARITLPDRPGIGVIRKQQQA